jgi:hypothetical protein
MINFLLIDLSKIKSMKKLITSIFCLNLLVNSFAQGQYQVPIDYSFATHFSNTNNDEMGQLPTGNGTLGDGLWAIQNSGIQISDGQSLKYSNVNCRPIGDMTMIVNCKMDITYWDALPNFSYYTIFSNGEHSIRILKGGNIQFVVKNGNNASGSFGYHVVEIDPGQDWPTIQNNWTVFELNYYSLSGTIYANVKSGPSVYLSTYYWSGGTSSQNSTNYPLQYAAADVHVELGVNNPAAPSKVFQGEIDYAYIYNRSIGSGESDNFLFNLDENLVVNSSTNEITTQQPESLVPGFITYQWFSVDGSGLRTDITGETSPSFTPTISGTYGVKLILPGDYVTVSEYKNISIGNTNSIEVIDLNRFHLFPNPASEFFQINDFLNGQLIIYDLTGKQVLQIENYNGNSVSINNLEIGVYLVNLINSNTNQIIRLIKK